MNQVLLNELNNPTHTTKLITKWLSKYYVKSLSPYNDNDKIIKVKY